MSYKPTTSVTCVYTSGDLIWAAAPPPNSSLRDLNPDWVEGTDKESKFKIRAYKYNDFAFSGPYDLLGLFAEYSS